MTASSSITVDGGTWQTGRLLTGGGLMPTISLSDPTSGPALTVGTDDGDSSFDGLIQDATGGSGSISKVGAGTLTLTHANTFTGRTDIDGGQVILGNAGALQNSTVSINVDNGLDITTHSINANLGGLAGSGDLSIGSQVVTVGANNAGTTHAGIVTVAPCLDADGDGVCDADDVCPGFGDGADADADGAPDGCDLCPNTIPGAPADSDGCFSPVIPADFDNDGDVDGDDLTAFQACARGPAIAMVAGCEDKDFDNDGDGDQSDFGVVQLCYSGQDSPGDPDCAD